MNYAVISKTIIKTEMQKRNMNFVDLSEKLKEIGVMETNITLANKINRGKFGFDFAIAVFQALGIDEIKIGEYLRG